MVAVLVAGLVSLADSPRLRGSAERESRPPKAEQPRAGRRRVATNRPLFSFLFFVQWFLRLCGRL